MHPSLLLSRAVSLIAILSSTSAREVCYRSVGCFSDGHSYTSVQRPMPDPGSPESIDTRFKFYKRKQNGNAACEITTVPETSLKHCYFSPKLPTVIIVHGFIERSSEKWMLEMKDALLQKANVNVFLTDWSKGSFELFNYLQAASNARVVGVQIAGLIRLLNSEYGGTPADFHIIGFSLGAHVAGYAGKALPGIGKITGLDPAQPGFEGFEDAVRLVPGDAQYVEVLHTSARPFIPLVGFGMISPCGHVDYYINNGAYQPGCSLPLLPPNLLTNLGDLANIPVSVVNSLVGCDHNRSHEIYMDVLLSNRCTFWGHPATAPDILEAPCTLDSCVPLRFETRQATRRGSYIVPTADAPPFCISNPRREAQTAKAAQTKLLDINERLIVPIVSTVQNIISSLFGR